MQIIFCYLHPRSPVNEICCGEDNHRLKSNMCAKEFSDSNFIPTVIDKISIFKK